MKQITFITLAIFILLTAGISASDIGYVLKDASNPNQVYIDAINELNYSVDYIGESQISLTNFSQYKVLLVGQGDFKEKALVVPVNKKNSVIVNTYHLKDWGWVEDGVSSKSPSRPQELPVLDKASFIVEGVSENFLPYEYVGSGTDLYKISYLSKYKQAKGIKTIVADDLSFLKYLGIYVPSNGAVVATIESGVVLKNSQISESRGVFMGITNTNLWTSETTKVFKNALVWAIEGEDKDDDGFFSDDDCNDYDASVNPNATEVPYDFIDQDCDGFDLIDVDNDGYIAEIVGGDDCDDNNAEYNINSANLSKNCVNDAPIINPIGKIVIYETENLSLIVDAQDPENDNLSYFINESWFEQNENYFNWETNYEDAGEYIFIIKVDDGELFSEIEVEVEVKNLNRLPELISEIPAQTWEEDANHSLNLSEYFIDYDGNDLAFVFFNTSDDKNIIIENITEDGVVFFSSNENWFGEDWVIFKAIDLSDRSGSLTNKIILNVSPVNDAPILLKNFDNITFNEDNNYTIYLNEYFMDIDSEIQYNVAGNSKIIINMENNIALLIPEENWFGTESIIFSATDNEFTIYSNEFNISVIDVGEYPEFEIMNCNTEILEDIEESCMLNASDFDNDELVFSVVSENYLECEIHADEIRYKSSQDYYGKASCLIKVSDKDGYDVFLHEVNITAVNDAPVISDYFPKNENLKIIENKNQEFEIKAYDIDSSIEINWFVDNLKVDSGSNYNFNKEPGSYSIKSTVTDNEFSIEKLWNVIVGPTCDFTCAEVGGYSCSENYFCPGEIINVSDSNSCCAVSCLKNPPKFSDAPKCSEKSDLIEITIKEPDNGDEFEIGETIEVEIKLKNKFEEKLDFDAEVHLYDLDEDESIEKIKKSMKIKSGDYETINLEIKIPEDIEENDFAVFVFVEDEEDRCNSNYVEIDIERQKHNVIIKNLEITPQLAFPGSNIKVSVEAKNIGSKDEVVYIKIENNELNISEQSEEFEIEKYGEDDKTTKIFYIDIPEDAEEKDYELKVIIVFENGENSETKIFGILKKLDNIISNNSDVLSSQTINLNYENPQIQETEKIIMLANKESQIKPLQVMAGNADAKGNWALHFIVALLIGIVILIIIVINFNSWSRSNVLAKKENLKNKEK